MNVDAIVDKITKDRQDEWYTVGVDSRLSIQSLRRVIKEELERADEHNTQQTG